MTGLNARLLQFITQLYMDKTYETYIEGGISFKERRLKFLKVGESFVYALLQYSSIKLVGCIHIQGLQNIVVVSIATEAWPVLATVRFAWSIQSVPFRTSTLAVMLLE